MTKNLYSRIIIPEALNDEGTHEFPGRKIQIGGKILPLEEQFQPGKSLNFYKGKIIS